MEARLSPSTAPSDATAALQALAMAVRNQGVPDATLELVHLRISQINGCAFCLDWGVRSARTAGETDDRLGLLAAWREAPGYTYEERAALGLAEAMTRMADRADAVPDPVWDVAADHFEEKALAALVVWIATTNAYNRINVATRRPPGLLA